MISSIRLLHLVSRPRIGLLLLPVGLWAWERGTGRDLYIVFAVGGDFGHPGSLSGEGQVQRCSKTLIVTRSSPKEKGRIRKKGSKSFK